jgi:hypothetical protein
MDSKDTVARRLAQAHFTLEPGLRLVRRLVAASQVEDDPREPVKLLEVNDNTTSDGILPVYFGPHTASGIHYPSVIVEITPEEYERLRVQDASLPNGWRLGPEIPRETSVSAA